MIVTFLELTISIRKDCKIETRTYQKSMNIYLYLPPTYAHPLSVIRCMIYVMLRNMTNKTVIENTTSKWQCFYSKGWTRVDGTPHYCNASAKVKTKCPSRTQKRKVNIDNGRNRIFNSHRIPSYWNSAKRNLTSLSRNMWQRIPRYGNRKWR